METVVSWLKRIGLIGSLILLLLYSIFVAYSLPRHILVHITGTEISRSDVTKKDGTTRTHDVRYVTAEALDGSARMFRNMDTGWGWPPYFKFDSGDLAAQATNFGTKDSEATVLVKYYGFRIHMLSWFPNVLSMKRVSPDYTAFPWLTTIVIVGHLILLGVIITFIRSFREDLSGE